LTQRTLDRLRLIATGEYKAAPEGETQPVSEGAKSDAEPAAAVPAPKPKAVSKKATKKK
jgi:hypothetical protein